MSKELELRDLLEEYLLELRLKRYSERTIKTVRNNTALFLTYIEKEYKITTLDKLSHVHIKFYVKYKLTLGVTASYVNNILKNIGMFFTYLVEEGYAESNICKRIKFQKQEKVIVKNLTDKEVARMLTVYNYETYLDARNKCIVALLVDTGIRNHELCNIKCVDIKGNAILIFGKGKKERLVPITPALAKIMLRYEQKRKLFLKERHQDEYYFLSQKGRILTIETIERIVRDCGQQAKVRKDIRCSPHTCRHYYAQAQLRNGLDLYSVSRLLGHEDLSITKRYLQSIKDEQVVTMGVKTSPLMNLK